MAKKVTKKAAVKKTAKIEVKNTEATSIVTKGLVCVLLLVCGIVIGCALSAKEVYNNNQVPETDAINAIEAE